MIRLRWTGPYAGARATPALALLAVFLLASACSVSTPPIRHLQLSSGATAVGSQDDPVILVEAVTMPDYLLRDELARRIDAVTLHYNPYLRWAEPLDLAVQRVLAEHLRELLDTRRVVRFPAAPRSEVDWRLSVRLQRFERESSRAVLLGEANWARAATPGGTVSSVLMEDEQALPANASGAETARALSDLLERFAGAVARARPDVD